MLNPIHETFSWTRDSFYTFPYRHGENNENIITQVFLIIIIIIFLSGNNVEENRYINIWADFYSGRINILNDHNYLLPTMDEIFSSLSDGKYIVSINSAKTHLYIGVDDKSRKVFNYFSRPRDTTVFYSI